MLTWQKNPQITVGLVRTARIDSELSRRVLTWISETSNLHIETYPGLHSHKVHPAGILSWSGVGPSVVTTLQPIATLLRPYAIEVSAEWTGPGLSQ